MTEEQVGGWWVPVPAGLLESLPRQVEFLEQTAAWLEAASLGQLQPAAQGLWHNRGQVCSLHRFRKLGRAGLVLERLKLKA